MSSCCRPSIRCSGSLEAPRHITGRELSQGVAGPRVGAVRPHGTDGARALGNPRHRRRRAAWCSPWWSMGVLVKQDEDRPEDFADVFDFEEAFERSYPWDARSDEEGSAACRGSRRRPPGLSGTLDDSIRHYADGRGMNMAGRQWISPLPEVRDGYTAAALRLRPGWGTDPLQGVGLLESGVRFQHPDRQRRNHARPRRSARATSRTPPGPPASLAGLPRGEATCDDDRRPPSRPALRARVRSRPDR